VTIACDVESSEPFFSVSDVLLPAKRTQSAVAPLREMTLLSKPIPWSITSSAYPLSTGPT